MNIKALLMWVASVLTLCLCLPVLAQAPQNVVVRLAELEIDPAQMESFRAAANEHAESALRAEPGVLAFYAVVEKEKPNRVRVLEMYVDADAYGAHLQTPHFQKFRAATDGMVTASTLHDAVPVLLGTKPHFSSTPLVRIAELEIDPTQLEAYKAAVTEEIEASIRVEPGVLAILAVALKDQPSHLCFLEIYADDRAYRRHLDSPHFRKYVDVTKAMITARRLFETEPITLAVKPR